jgi:hypothetical protein
MQKPTVKTDFAPSERRCSTAAATSALDLLRRDRLDVLAVLEVLAALLDTGRRPK